MQCKLLIKKGRTNATRRLHVLANMYHFLDPTLYCYNGL